MFHDELLEVLVDLGGHGHREDLIFALQAYRSGIAVCRNPERSQRTVRRLMADDEQRRAFAGQVVPVGFGFVGVELQRKA